MSKVQSLPAAIAAHVTDGMSIAMGCGLESLIPFAASHELIRQRRRKLSLIGPISDIQFDQLVGAGCVRKIIASWVGNVAAGLGHNYRRATETGVPKPIEIEEHSNFTIGLGLQAAASGLPFLPTRSIKGSDIANEAHFGRVHCPFSGEELIAVRAIQPDLAILHVQRADDQGNAHVWGNYGVMREAAMAAKKVILTCEELVDRSVILSDPNRTLIPGLIVDAVVCEPFGCHPSYVQGYYDRDNDAYLAWDGISHEQASTEAWLDEWVYGVADRAEYLAKLGQARLAKLRPAPALAGPVDYGAYA